MERPTIHLQDEEVASIILTYGAVPDGTLDGVMIRQRAALATATPQGGLSKCQKSGSLDGALGRLVAAQAAGRVSQHNAFYALHRSALLTAL